MVDEDENFQVLKNSKHLQLNHKNLPQKFR